MLKLVYSSWLSHALKQGDEEMPSADLSTVGLLRERLSQRSDPFPRIFSQPDLVYVSVNGQIASDDKTLIDGDKVIFFSPIAGG